MFSATNVGVKSAMARQKFVGLLVTSRILRKVNNSLESTFTRPTELCRYKQVVIQTSSFNAVNI
jgi:hypothetical protein